MSKKKFTIITVCYNAENCIKETIESLLEQTCNDYEYIIKDGVSTDRTLEMAYALLEGRDNVQIVSSPDKGIYDAMNQAIHIAEGEYIYFLNAGDIFASKNVLKSISERMVSTKADIVYGNIIEIDKEKEYLRVYTKKNSKLWYFCIGACLCHQGVFCKKELFKIKEFDIRYKVCADREWQLYHIKNGIKTYSTNLTISKVLKEGFSKKHIQDLEKETEMCIKDYCGIGYAIYYIIVMLKKNKKIKILLQKIEQKFSCR